ncbi:MAG: hypothetical protein JXB17_13005 [Bacteroidales bacterium]|nr:hypothetical protein [Bacteroidales bacterium]
MKRKKFFMLCIVVSLLIVTCEKDGENENNTGYSKGVLITNEGAYGNNNGSISYFSKDSSKIINNLFCSINKRMLGDVVQSVGIANNKAFIVVNNSQKIEVVNLETFESIGTIFGVSYPRYFLKTDDTKAYLTNGNMQGTIYIINLMELKIKDSINVGYGPERLIESNGFIYIANSGGWGIDSTISVIDPENDEVIENIIVGDCPVDLIKDKNNDIWVLCKGKVIYDFVTYEVIEETESKLVRISGNDHSVKDEITIGTIGDYFNPTQLSVNRSEEIIYFAESDGIYFYDINSSELSDSPVILNSFYGFGIDSEDDIIYGLEAASFASSGYLFRYKLNGELIDSFKTGIGPNNVIFY